MFRRKKPVGEVYVVPFRMMEAARVSLYTITQEERVPLEVRYWIAAWLNDYNRNVVQYMRMVYGEEVFDDLDKITVEVSPPDPFHQWEKEFKGHE